MVAFETGVVPLRTWPWKATAVTVRVRLMVAVWPALSVRRKVTGAEVSPVVGMPVMAPEGARVRPVALSAVPEVTVQV